jgi:nucleoside-triphosphatase THEP1
MDPSTSRLFCLTGDVQTGKTRWLLRLLDELAASGVTGLGVVSPGIWRKNDIDGEREDAPPFEKLGIEVVLLPQNERLPFAARRDLLDEEGMGTPTAEADRARLLWAIRDDSIQAVNRHFDALMQDPMDGLLVVDELGRLELEQEGGFTQALRLLEAGPTAHWPCALVVVRDRLARTAASRLAPAWGEVVPLGPDAQGRDLVRSSLALE